MRVELTNNGGIKIHPQTSHEEMLVVFLCRVFVYGGTLEVDPCGSKKPCHAAFDAIDPEVMRFNSAQAAEDFDRFISE